MVDDERKRLSRRAQDLRRLFDGMTDPMARDAITVEIQKQQAKITEIDERAAAEKEKSPVDVVVAKARPDIIS
jgi:hypothetical protein